MRHRFLFPALVTALALTAGCGGPILSPLVIAARQGRLSAIPELIERGADPNAPSGRNGWTPLLHAIHKNQIESAQALLEGGARVNGSCCRGMTPLIMAAGYGQADMVRMLLLRGADPWARSTGGLTALDVAVTGVPHIDAFTVGRCQTETVRALVQHDSDLRLRTGAWGVLDRLAAALKRCPEIEAMLRPELPNRAGTAP